MFISLFRAVIMFVTLLVIVRLMGKRQLGEMQPFELVITLLIADLASSPLADTTIPIFYGIIPIVVLCAMHFLISLLGRKSVKLRTVFSGVPQIAITPDGINYEVLKKLNMNINDLIEASRSADVFYLEDIQYGIFETNGSFYALKNDPPEYERSLPIIMVMDGHLMKQNMTELEVDEVAISKLLKKCGLNTIKDTLIMTMDDVGNVYAQGYDKSFVTLKGDA